MKKASFISPACGWKFQIKIGYHQKVGDLLAAARTKKSKIRIFDSMKSRKSWFFILREVYWFCVIPFLKNL